MVYDTNKLGSTKRERMKISGVLVGITSNSDPTKCKVFDKEHGLFTWVQLSILKEKELGKVQDNFFYVTAYDIDYSKMPELKRADELLIAKKNPLIELNYYDSVPKLAVNENGEAKYIETVKIEDGKKVIVREKMMYINHRMSSDDVINSFKIIQDDIDLGSNDNDSAQKEQEIAGLKDVI